MAERRTLSSAVSNSIPGADPDVVRSFITQGAIVERPVAAPIAINDNHPPHFADVATDATAASTRSSKSKANRFQPIGLIPVTVRLRPEVAGALKRASLERELNGEEVFTQQDIVEQAL